MENQKITQYLNLSISCKNLINTDLLSLTDAYVEVYEIIDSNQLKKIGVTEVIMNNLNPNFVTSFKVGYFFRERQTLLFKVFDSDCPEPRPRTFIGEATCRLAVVLVSPGQQLTCPIIKNKSINGIILVRAVPINEKKKVVFDFEGEFLEKRSRILHKYKPMFFLSHFTESNTWQRVYESEFRFGKNPHWKSFEIPLNILCGSDYNSPIKFELYDHYDSQNHDFIASDEFTLNSYLNDGITNLVLKDPERKNKLFYINSGIIHIRKLEITRVPTFLDYIQGGCKIKLHIAIDYTSSNGYQKLPTSLHYIDPNGQSNQYETALEAVSQILLEYNSDHSVPLYGFGGSINGAASYCFSVNFDETNPNVDGLTNIVDTYRKSLSVVTLAGPSLLSPFLAKVINDIENQQINQVYNIALILTDGDISDLQDTVDLIVKASKLALSIIIIGIGNGPFEEMENLEGNHKKLTDRNGVKMDRDIVHYVAFKDYRNSPHRLRSAVLEEIPREVVNFFGMNEIKPNN